MKHLTSLATAFAAIIALANPVCPSCGREASTEDAKSCAHCYTPLPRTAAPAPEASNPTPGEEAQSVTGKGGAFEALKAEYTTAKELESGNRDSGIPARPAHAFFHYRNALALAPLAKLSDERQRVALSSGMRRSLASTIRFAETCPACNGERKYTLKQPDVGQADGRIGVRDYLKEVVACPLCSGKGTIPGYRNHSRTTAMLAEGRREFDSAHLAAGSVKCGYAWAPATVAASFTPIEYSAVATSFGAPCPSCGWSGFEPCKTCKGEGTLRCRHQGCKNGWIERTVTRNATSRKTIANSNRKEVELCPECRGTTYLTCDKCAGARLVPCAKCKGEGLAPLCTACNGEGLVNCRKCNGSGRFTKPGRDALEGECPECRGLGRTACRGCTGLGRKSGNR